MPVTSISLINTENVLLQFVTPSGLGVNGLEITLDGTTRTTHQEVGQNPNDIIDGVVDFTVSATGQYFVTSAESLFYAASSNEISITNLEDNVFKITIEARSPEPVNFPYPCDGSSGIKTVAVGLLKSINALPVPLNHIATGDIIVSDPGAYTSVFLREGTGAFSQRMRESVDGIIYTTQVDLMHNQERLAATQKFAAMIGKDIIAVIEDENGYKRIIGTKERPARLQWSTTQGGGSTSPNDNALIIKHVDDTPCPYWTGEYTA